VYEHLFSLLVYSGFLSSADMVCVHGHFGCRQIMLDLAAY
jgi:hypothetical protein